MAHRNRRIPAAAAHSRERSRTAIVTLAIALFALAVGVLYVQSATAQDGQDRFPRIPVYTEGATFTLRDSESARSLQEQLDRARVAAQLCDEDRYKLITAQIAASGTSFRRSAEEFRKGIERELPKLRRGQGSDYGFYQYNFVQYDAAATEFARAAQHLEAQRAQRFAPCRARPPAAQPGDRVGLRTPGPDATQYNFYANLGSGVQFDQFKETTLGTIFVPGADRPFLFSRGAATGFNVDAGLGVERSFLGLVFPAPPVKSEFNFRFTNSSATASASTAPGETAVFTLLEPVNGVPVIGIGSADATVKSSLQSLNFQYTETWRLDEQWRFNLGLRYQRVETEHVGRITSPLLPDFLAKQTLRTNDNYLGPLFGVQYTAELPVTVPGTNVPIVFEGYTWLSPTLRISDGSARQTVRIPGAAPPFNDLTVSTDDSRAGFALLGGAEAAIAVRITPNITVRLGGGVRINTAQSHYVAPISPGQTARFTTDFQAPRQVRLGATFRF
jgi:hypothetical protein